MQRRTHLGFGRQYVEYAWNYGAWVVGLEGRQGELRVVRVSTSLSAQRTASGVGPGSGIPALLKSYPNAACVDRWRLDPYPGRWIVVATPGGRMTAFEIISFGGTYERSKPDRVAAVLIQARWLSRSEYDSECSDAWRMR